MIRISHTGRDRQRTEGKGRRVVLPVGWLPALAHSTDPQILIYHRNNDWFPTRMNGLWRLSHFLMRVWFLASSIAYTSPPAKRHRILLWTEAVVRLLEVVVGWMVATTNCCRLFDIVVIVQHWNEQPYLAPSPGRERTTDRLVAESP